MENGMDLLGAGLGVGFIVLIIILAIAEMVLKGIALWKSARLEQTAWFVVLFIINTAGILPLIYILAVANPKLKRIQSGEAAQE
jgi:methionyl-tRNA synthetase